MIVDLKRLQDTAACFICYRERPKDRIEKRTLGDGKQHPVCDQCRQDVLGEEVARCQRRV